jgi:lipopolysaccharide O-acetyltransferase
MRLRDFKSDSLMNLLFRASRSFSKRVRGRLFFYAGMFDKASKSSITFGVNPIFINTKNICFNGNNHFGRFTRIEVFNNQNINPKVIFGEFVSSGDYFHLGCAYKITIGNNVLIGSNVLIIDHNHGKPRTDVLNKSTVKPRNRPLSGKEIMICDDVWIGDGVCILPGSFLGRGSIIAANSVVQGTVPEYTIYRSRFC